MGEVEHVVATFVDMDVDALADFINDVPRSGRPSKSSKKKARLRAKREAISKAKGTDTSLSTPTQSQEDDMEVEGPGTPETVDLYHTATVNAVRPRRGERGTRVGKATTCDSRSQTNTGWGESSPYPRDISGGSSQTSLGRS